MDWFFHEWYSCPGGLAGYAARDAGPHPVIVLEGLDGVGKSTVIDSVVRRTGALPLGVLPEAMKPVKAYVDGMAPLPQLLYHLSGLLHISDLARAASHHSPVLIHRYLVSQYLKHSMRTGKQIGMAAAATRHLWPYLLPPNAAVYISARPSVIAERLARRQSLSPEDERLQVDTAYAASAAEQFAIVAGRDPRGIMIDSSDMTAERVVDQVCRLLESATGYWPPGV